MLGNGRDLTRELTELVEAQDLGGLVQSGARPSVPSVGPTPLCCAPCAAWASGNPCFPFFTAAPLAFLCPLHRAARLPGDGDRSRQEQCPA